MIEGMFPPVKLERKTAPSKFVAADGEQIRDMGEKTIPFTTHEEIHSASIVKPLISMQKVVRAGNVAVLDQKESAHSKY